MKSNVIPKEWVRSELQGFCNVLSGNAFKSKDFVSDGVPVVKISNVQYGEYVEKNQEYLPSQYLDDYSNYIVSGDDLLIALTRPITNEKLKICRYPKSRNQGLLNQRVAKLTADKCLPESFILYQFRTEEFMKQVKAGLSETLQPNLSPKSLAGFHCVLPPLAEQKVIADKLDTLLAQVETSKARLDRIPQILKTFRQSVLAAAVSGKLTEEWRAQCSSHNIDTSNFEDELFLKGVTHGNFGKKLAKAPSIGTDELDLVVRHIEGWPLVRVGSICQSIVPNRDKPKKFSGGYHWLLTPHFREHSIWIDYSKIENGLSEQEVLEYKAKVIKSGNVIMSCVGRVGLSAVLEEDSVINQQLHAFIINSSIKAEYLAYCIRANVKYFEAQATSTTVSYLNKTSCNSLPIPLPSFEEQAEIVRQVEELFAFADSIEQKANAALERVNNLTQSILAKAFRGELTADWRAESPELISGENSAEALLAKIKAERDTLSSKKKPKKKAVKKAK
ncbi:restriction endonuclease subunit S [Pseudoalteromonas sp. APM04]|uniref:restriction endonuclease subunit S n=1 Tax=Pseudoalteromonas sp. APM04 TaxID=2699396 RepID=UPI001FB4D6F1|nr:restriction endonuclease subunit S [Pseudoalteromonas sp. APM04]UOB73233.1 restriction endonuclease subunit S [Pseudoalteromonas sp. APM04]